MPIEIFQLDPCHFSDAQPQISQAERHGVIALAFGGPAVKSLKEAIDLNFGERRR
jgi:hypothetical protein